MAKSDPVAVVLVSPAGVERVVEHPVTVHNLIARGYKPKAARKRPSATPAPAVVAAPRPAPKGTAKDAE